VPGGVDADATASKEPAAKSGQQGWSVRGQSLLEGRCWGLGGGKRVGIGGGGQGGAGGAGFRIMLPRTLGANGSAAG